MHHFQPFDYNDKYLKMHHLVVEAVWTSHCTAAKPMFPVSQFLCLACAKHCSNELNMETRPLPMVETIHTVVAA